jgi:glyoxylase-like metal-dependent hydrolase (beta-lactamase superfamily II)
MIMSRRSARLQQLSDRVWVYCHDWQRLEPAVGLVLTDEGWLAIDGGNSPAHGRRVFEAMQCIRERPVRYVINTHRHFDHVFGNQAFEAPVIASRRCRERFAQNLEGDWAPQQVHRWLHETMFSRVSTLSTRDFRGLQLIPPSLSFEGELALDLDGSDVRLFPLAGAHSDDSIGVFLPHERVLFLGDALYLREGPEGRFLRLLELLERIAPLGVEVYVPGHEAPHGRLEFEKLWSYCRELLRAVRSLIYSGAKESDVLKAVPFDRRFEGTSFLSPRFHRRLVQAAYRELASIEGLC